MSEVLVRLTKQNRSREIIYLLAPDEDNVLSKVPRLCFLVFLCFVV